LKDEFAHGSGRGVFQVEVEQWSCALETKTGLAYLKHMNHDTKCLKCQVKMQKDSGLRGEALSWQAQGSEFKYQTGKKYKTQRHRFGDDQRVFEVESVIL
jgi:hypothetical protein